MAGCIGPLTSWATRPARARSKSSVASTAWSPRSPGIAPRQAAWPGRSSTLARSHRSYRPGLFHCYAVPDLPRTDNGLEQLFGSQRYHERRATGRKMASPAIVLRGEVRVIAATATRLRPPTAGELGRVDRQRWRDLRRRLEPRRLARTLRTRFRRNPGAYLAELERKACQSALPT